MNDVAPALQASRSGPRDAAVRETIARLFPLEWERREDNGEIEISARTRFGTYEVNRRSGYGWSWGYCFDEYFDNERFSCEGEDEGLALALNDWHERLFACGPEADLLARSEPAQPEATPTSPRQTG